MSVNAADNTEYWSLMALDCNRLLSIGARPTWYNVTNLTTNYFPVMS